MSLSIRTSGAGEVAVDSATLDRLQQSISGPLLVPGSPGYDAARTIWNAMIERAPALVVQCRNAGEVAAAVRFAAERKLLVSIRGGGHNIAGNALCDRGLMIDLSPMKGVRVDASRRTAWVEPGVTLGEFDAEAQKVGLATPLGINSTTGVAGLTLGGGFGWLSRRLGLTIDNLTEAEVVLASGERVRASETVNPDLFWAIRGGGGNYGVVTGFEFRLHPIGPEVLSGLVVHPLDAARDVLKFYREFVKTAPEEFVCWFVLRKAPPLPFLAAEWHGKEILALAICWSGDLQEGERVTRPLRSFGSPIADVVAPHPYAGWQTVLDPLLTPGARNYWKSHDFVELSDGLIEVLLAAARKIPDPQCELAFAQLGGAVSRVPREATAYTHRDAEYVLNVHGRWADAARDTACIAWARDLFAAAAPFATGGAYVNFLTQDEGERVQAAYGSNYARLVQLKRHYDPANLFCVNQNIRPADTAAAAGV